MNTTIKNIAISEITAENNIRKVDTTSKDYKTLLDSIKRNGILQPLTVNEENELINGYHRFTVAQSLKMETVPCTVVEALTEAESKRIAVHSNVQKRGKLSDVVDYIKEQLTEEGRTLKEISEELGVSDKQCREVLKIDEMPEEIKDNPSFKNLSIANRVILTKHKKLMMEGYTEELSKAVKDGTLDETLKVVRKAKKEAKKENNGEELEKKPIIKEVRKPQKDRITLFTAQVMNHGKDKTLRVGDIQDFLTGARETWE